MTEAREEGRHKVVAGTIKDSMHKSRNKCIKDKRGTKNNNNKQGR